MFNKKETTKLPMYIMLVGLPCTGKSTWRQKMQDFLRIHEIPLTVANADDLIYALRDELNSQPASEKKLCYTDMFFSGYMKVVRERFEAILIAAKKQENGIVIIDTTNLNPKLRKQFIQDTGSSNVHALYFRVQNVENWKIRLLQRNQSSEQIIPADCIARMEQDFVEPDESELFRSVSVCPSISEPAWEDNFKYFIDVFIEKYHVSIDEKSQDLLSLLI